LLLTAMELRPRGMRRGSAILSTWFFEDSGL
jgi:hypothetical protein